MNSSPSLYEQLESALRERLVVIADREHYQRDAAGHLARLQAVSETVSRLHAQLPGGADPRLKHYLERCSFDKALAFLESARGEAAT